MTLAPTCKGRLKWIFSMLETSAGELPNRPSGRRRLCGHECFAAGKTSAQVEFTSAEHLKYRRVEAAKGRRNPKRKDFQSEVLSFWYG